MSKVLRTISSVLLISSFFFAALATPVTAAPAQATITFVVNNAGDAGDANLGDNVCKTSAGVCTLRAAMEQANAHAGYDIISIPAMTILINSQLEVRYIYGNDTSVTIQGAGQGKTIIDGQQKTRAFYFEARTGTHTVQDLTIQSAWNLASSSADRWVKNGGGIFSEAKLTVRNVTIYNSRAQQGGGIYGEFSFSNPQGDLNLTTLDLQNVTIDHCQSLSPIFGDGGGGLFNGSLLTADGLTLTNNYAVVGGAGLYQNSPLSKSMKISTVKNFNISGNVSVDGVGVDNDLGDIEFFYGKMDSNVAQGCRPNASTCDYGSGAGVYNNEGTMHLTGVTFSNNWVKQPRGSGGAIFNVYPMTLQSVTFVGNKAASGAAIWNGHYDTSIAPASMTIDDAAFVSNIGQNSTSPVVDSIGGAIYNRGAMMVTNSFFDQNQAKSGGAIYNYLYLTLASVSITRGSAIYGSAITNGHNDNVDNKLTLINTTIGDNVGTTGNPESFGGGIYNQSMGKIDMNNTSIVRNTANRGGGLVNLGAVDIVNSMIALNNGRMDSPDCRGSLVSDGNNLILSTSNCSYTAAAGDVIGKDPKVGPLSTSYPAYYYPLLVGSPAINAGYTPKCNPKDIRGVSRPFGPVCDIGSYEWTGSNKAYLPLVKH